MVLDSKTGCKRKINVHKPVDKRELRWIPCELRRSRKIRNFFGPLLHKIYTVFGFCSGFVLVSSGFHPSFVRVLSDFRPTTGRRKVGSVTIKCRLIIQSKSKQIGSWYEQTPVSSAFLWPQLRDCSGIPSGFHGRTPKKYRRNLPLVCRQSPETIRRICGKRFQFLSLFSYKIPHVNHKLLPNPIGWSGGIFRHPTH